MITLQNANSTLFTTQGLGSLTDITSGVVVEELNGGYELTMEYPITGIHYKDIQLRRIIYCKPNPYSKPQPFRIYSISKPINMIVTINAAHISYDLSGFPVNSFVGTSPKDTMTKLKSNSTVAHDFSFNSTVTTEGEVKVEDPRSTRAVLGNNVLSAYGGEFEFDGFMVYHRQDRGMNRGVSIRYGKNLTDINQEENITDTYTGVYPYWTGYEYNEETGEQGDKKSVYLPEKIVNVEGTFDFTKILTLDLSNEWQDPPTEDELRKKTVDYIVKNEIGIPKISIDISFLQLTRSSEYSQYAILEEVELGDRLEVEFIEAQISATARCIKTTYNIITDKYDTLTLGEAKSNLSVAISDSNKQVNDKLEQQKIHFDAEVGNIKIDLADIEIAVIEKADIEYVNANFAHISNGVIDNATIGDASITTAKIQDAAITTAKIADAAIENAQIANGSIDNAKILDASITGAKIQDASIGTAQIGDAQITVAKIQDAFIDNLVATQGKFESAHIGELTSNNIQAGAITAGKLSANSVKADNIQAGAITADKIATDSITSDKILAGTIVANDLAANSITTDKITTGAVTADKIAADSITTDKIVAGTIVADDLAANSITTDKIQADAITTDKIGANQVTANKIAANSITSDKIQAGSIEADDISAKALDAIAVNAGTIVANDIEAGEIKISNANILDGSISGAKITNASITNAQISELFVADAFVKNITADKIKGGTLDAKDITVTNLSADSITVGKINGVQIATGAIDESKLEDMLSGKINTAVEDVARALDEAGIIKDVVAGVVETVTIYYASNNDPNTPPDNGWSETVPKWVEGLYIWSKTITTNTAGGVSEKAPVCITGQKGDSGVDAVSLHVISSNGHMFKNTTSGTTLTIEILTGSVRITSSKDMYVYFGQDSRIIWTQKKKGQIVYENIPNTDPRLSDNGFILTLTPDDVRHQTVFNCALDY